MSTGYMRNQGHCCNRWPLSDKASLNTPTKRTSEEERPEKISLFVAVKQRGRIYEQVKTFGGQTEMAQHIGNRSAREDRVFKEEIMRICFLIIWKHSES